MKKNKRGISSIIATLILILLTIVLVGIVWIVVNNIVNTSTKQVNSGAQCLNSAVEVTSASCNATYCNVTIQRTLGTDNISGVRLIFTNASQDSNISDVSGNILTLASTSQPNIFEGISSVNEVDAAVYFTDAAGNKNPCSGAAKYNTVQQF
ncbi:MAG: archaellin/type IV pilin N-terminal domain-containing protein [Candidatus Nanoarchaeia archaeon]